MILIFGVCSMRNRYFRVIFLFTLIGLGWAQQASAQEWNCDVDDYITKAIGIEEPWLENAGYLFSQVTNAQPGSLTLAPEVEAKLNDHVGMELDLPTYTANTPIGSAPATFGPAAAGLKLATLHTCNMGRGMATLLTFEIEGQYWADPRRSVLPGQGNAVSAQVMWAQLWYPWFTQGEAGYTQRIGLGISSGWFVNTSLGRSISTAYAAQLEVEVDNQLILDDGRRGMEGSVMPQVAYHVTPVWLLAVGEQASFQQSSSQPKWSTWVMAERDF
jgi:hypothetical protein